MSLTADVSFFFLVLYAIKEDSEKVPTLLTDYILKGRLSICHFVQQTVNQMKWTKTWPFVSALQSCVPPKAQSSQGALCAGDFLYSPCFLWPCAACPSLPLPSSTMDPHHQHDSIHLNYNYCLPLSSHPPILHYKLRLDLQRGRHLNSK